MVFAFRIPELEFVLRCGGLHWCYVYLEQRSEVMSLIKQFEAIGFRQCVDV
jgi:hypothetical protein